MICQVTYFESDSQEAVSHVQEIPNGENVAQFLSRDPDLELAARLKWFVRIAASTWFPWNAFRALKQGVQAMKVRFWMMLF